MINEQAPEWHVSEWFNTQTPINLEALRGKVVVLKAFQILCPGCVSHALPQAMKVKQFFNANDVVVVGLHTVFEHYDAQGTAAALRAFLHEYRINFPVGIDTQIETVRLPKTMQAYQMQGTPTTILIDKQGVLRQQALGQVDDMALGAAISALLHENKMGNAIEPNGGACPVDGECID